ncbi:uncharacterized protein LOC124380766 isoform X2 [Silurus meridionalis]|uniref:uncharacterized protein LOC124380766 isoform X2 n=1 Tax=Silurus meridionalis TaxID=175797 RepID=UPI001EEAF62F|nr:uncharacterized protein LOC124380766 isoform X2 [Silurus meridionalis]
MRHSRSVHELFDKGKGAQTFNQSRTGKRTPTYFHRLALDSVISSKGSLVLLNGPNAIEVHKPRKLSQQVNGAHPTDVYLPAITKKMTNLQAAKENLSNSCPYMYSSRRRRSTCTVISQKKASDSSTKTNYLKEIKESRKSNVLVTMLYLGHGKLGTTQDEMKVLQQKCGGENICVFKGSVQPGEQFQFISQRHLGYPFSVTFYVNGIIAGRISSCCEYRYSPGFQQGRKSCFRLTRLSGGKPCYKCVNSRHGIGSEPEDIIHHSIHTLKSHEGDMDSCRSSPLFIPVGMERYVQRTRKLSKDSSKVLTDSDDMNDCMTEKKRSKRQNKRYVQQKESKGSEASQDKRDTREDETKSTLLNSQIPILEKSINVKEHGKDKPKASNEDKVPELLQDKQALSKQIGKKTLVPRESNGKSRNGNRLRDFYEECVEMSAGLESGLEQQKWFKANKFERNKLREQLTVVPRPNDSATELELSEESENNAAYLKSEKISNDPKTQEIQETEALEKKQELQKKLDAMMEVLNTSDEVELVLRNTGVTDELLRSFVAELKNSLSEVTMVNLNLNHIGPPGVHVLLDLLQAKSEIKGLLLFGNHLGDAGVQMLLSGIVELQEKTAAASRLPPFPKQFYFSVTSFALIELDLGGNGIGSEGLRVLGTFMRYHSKLEYLGLAQSCCSSMDAWYVFFESLRENNKLTHIILDENSLGDQGVKLFAEALQINESLQKIDLDRNNFGEVGGNALFEAVSRSQCCLKHLSLEDNYISTALMSKFQEVVKTSDVHTTLNA